VTIYRLVASNTIEEKIVELHSQKRDLADNLLEGSEMSGKMSVEAMEWELYNLCILACLFVRLLRYLHGCR
jgi:hypothetical protein